MGLYVAKVIARYSASALDLATTSCFLLFQDIKLPLMNTQYPDVESLYVGEPTPVCITIANNLSLTPVLIQHPLTLCFFDITENMN